MGEETGRERASGESGSSEPTASSGSDDATTAARYQRREFLSNAGLSVATAVTGARAVLGQGTLRRTRLVTVRSGPDGTPFKTRSVPKKWYAHERAMQTVQSAIVTVLDQHDFVTASWTGVGEKATDGYRYSELVVGVDSEATGRADDELADDLSGLGVDVADGLVTDAIQVRPMDDPEQTACRGTESPLDYPGGVRIRAEHGGYGTAGFRLVDYVGEEYLLTANHVVRGDCEIATTDTVLDTYGNVVGDVVDGHKNHDWAVVRPNVYYDLTDEIWYDGGRRIPLAGYVTDDGVTALKGRRGAVHSQGATTGHTLGVVTGQNFTGYGADYCTRYFDNGVRIEGEVADGDSGGPSWAVVDDKACALTVASLATTTVGTVRNCGGGDTDRWKYRMGWPIWRIVKNTSYHVAE